MAAPRVNLSGLPGHVRAQVNNDWGREFLRSPRRWAILGTYFTLFLLPAVLLFGYLRQLPHKPLAFALAVLLLVGGQLLLHVGLSIPRKRFLVRRVSELGFCTGCGYDVRATRERCPECGTVPYGARPVSA